MPFMVLKLDVVGIPDIAAGTMGNGGLITYKCATSF